jgi:acetyl esterase/lipase
MDREAIAARIAAHPLEGTPREMRDAFEALADWDAIPLPEDVTVETLSDGSMRVSGPGGGPEIVWFHGGGYVFGGPRTHLRPAAYLASKGARVTLPAYPLAPESAWPAQRDAALAAIPEDPVPVLAGDSAGGHLALVVAMALGRRGKPPPALLLFSPNTDRSGLSDTRQGNEGTDPIVDDAGDRALARMCFGGMHDDDPEVSPVLDDLKLLPPTHVEVGAEEVLLGDARVLAGRARAAGAEVTLNEVPGLLHMGQLWAPAWDLAAASLDRALAFAETQVSGTSRSRASA